MSYSENDVWLPFWQLFPISIKNDDMYKAGPKIWIIAIFAAKSPIISKWKAFTADPQNVDVKIVCL
jgi:hypothetical protein